MRISINRRKKERVKVAKNFILCWLEIEQNDEQFFEMIELQSGEESEVNLVFGLNLGSFKILSIVSWWLFEELFIIELAPSNFDIPRTKLLNIRSNLILHYK